MVNNVIRFPGRRVTEGIRQQACVWLARLDALEGDSAEVHEQIRQWLKEDPRHLQALLEVAELWDQLSVLSELSEIFPLRQRPLSYGRRAFLAAGIASVLIGAGGLAVYRQAPGGTAAGEFSYVTAIGQQTSIELPDGSEILLNTNTQVDVSYTEGQRTVYLRRGEGLFTVSSDPSRPFRVFAGSQVVEAVGTAFSVEHVEASRVEVLVTEGEVRFSPLAAATSATSQPEALPVRLTGGLSLLAGDYALAVRGETETVEHKQLQVSEMEAKLAWRHGMLLFEGDALRDVLREVSRYTSIQIDADSAIQDIPVEGYFRAGDVEGLLVAMKSNFNIDAERVSANRIHLSSL